MKKLRFSPSSLNLFRDCPKCFWLDKKDSIKRPRGIFPSLPSGMDIVIKSYFDVYRKKNKLPPEIDGKVKGRLFADIDRLTMWRNWRATDLVYEDKGANAYLVGALDDCLVEDSSYIPLDYKTRGSQLKSDPRLYYQTQLDCYCLMLESSGYKARGLAYLVYYWPEQVKEDGVVKFHVEPIEIETNIESAKQIVRDAANLLSGPMPEAEGRCEYCSLVRLRKKFISSRKEETKSLFER